MHACLLACMSAHLESDSVVMRGDVREEAGTDVLSLWIYQGLISILGLMSLQATCLFINFLICMARLESLKEMLHWGQ